MSKKTDLELLDLVLKPTAGEWPPYARRAYEELVRRLKARAK
jgi:hypothetical protein